MLVETLGRLANRDEPLSQAPRKWDGEAWQRSYLRQLLGLGDALEAALPQMLA